MQKFRTLAGHCIGSAGPGQCTHSAQTNINYYVPSYLYLCMTIFRQDNYLVLKIYFISFFLFIFLSFFLLLTQCPFFTSTSLKNISDNFLKPGHQKSCFSFPPFSVTAGGCRKILLACSWAEQVGADDRLK